MASETPQLLQINFRYQPPDAIAAQQFAWERAHAIAQVPGLLWKIWIHNAETSEAGGIYLFQDLASAQAYLDGAIVAQIKQLPGAETFTAKLFDVNPSLSQVTRAPLG